jgi:hypothetical protein
MHPALGTTPPRTLKRLVDSRCVDGNRRLPRSVLA